MRQKWQTAQRRTSNIARKPLGVGCWALGVRTTHAWNFFTITAGFPATTVFGSTLLVTTDPAATTEFSPMVKPFRITAFIPIHTLSQILTGTVFSLGRAGRFLKYGASASASIRRCAGSIG